MTTREKSRVDLHLRQAAALRNLCLSLAKSGAALRTSTRDVSSRPAQPITIESPAACKAQPAQAFTIESPGGTLENRQAIYRL